jgi:hypothetical protein
MSSSERSGCLTAIMRLFGGGTPVQYDHDTRPRQVASVEPVETYPFRVRDDFLSAAESSLYHVLLSIVGDQATICPKVRLADILFVTRPNENYGAYNRISSRHVDFLLCQPQTMKPIVALELADASHASLNRQERNAFVGGAFEAAGLPLVRLPVQRGYNRAELEAMFAPHLKVTQAARLYVAIRSALLLEAEYLAHDG